MRIELISYVYYIHVVDSTRLDSVFFAKGIKIEHQFDVIMKPNNLR